MSRKTGGCAFPSAPVYDGNGNGLVEGSNGMTMRQYYKGQALAGILAGAPLVHDEWLKMMGGPGLTRADVAAKVAGLMADAMLEEDDDETN